jgi:thiol-disulfide isomerase/thioredoxin
LLIERTEGAYRVHVINGAERIEVPRVVVSGKSVVLAFDHYGSAIEAKLEDGGESLAGTWRKKTTEEKPAELPFHAIAGERPRFEAGTRVEEGTSPPLQDGRWNVRFRNEEAPAVGIFENVGDGRVQGTFLTTTGDYRYLAGSYSDGKLRLSCFDGAHAFLFHARLEEDGSLNGDFWSRDAYHDTWTATRDDEARLPDSFGLTRATEGVDLSSLVFPDTLGQSRSLGDAEFAGPVRIVEIFGTWCPNCNDATRYLVELHDRYAARGLVIVGLAYELSGEFERDAEQVRVYADHHQVPYTLLVAGRYGRDEASRSFPLIDRIRAFPTTLILDGDGRIRAVHTGFSGPATGEEHRKLRDEFERRIESLLKEAAG